MSDAHPVRNGIIATTVGGVLVALILWIAGFVGIVWKGLGSAISWLWHHLTASISLRVWLVLVALVYAVAVTVLLRKGRTPRDAWPGSRRHAGRARLLDRQGSGLIHVLEYGCAACSANSSAKWPTMSRIDWI
jgi:hypothetical protein